MSYPVIEFHGLYYIKGREGDPTPPVIGPYRYEQDARRVADQFNEPGKQLNMSSESIPAN